MDWNELAEKISKMTPEQRNQPVLTFDNNEGEFCELTELIEWDDLGSQYHGVLYLWQADCWWSKGDKTQG